MDCTKQRGSNIFREVVSVIKEGFTEKFLSLVEKNPDLFQSVDESKATLLHYSSAYGNEVMIQYILDGGMDINDQDSMGNTALMMALRKKQTAIVIQTLLAAGSDITILNNDKKSALNMVCEEHYFTPQIGQLFFNELSEKIPKYKEVARKLIEAGFKFYQICYFKCPKIIKYILKYGKIPTDSVHPLTKKTGLHVCISVKDRKSVELIVKYAVKQHNKTNTLKEVNNEEELVNDSENKLLGHSRQVSVFCDINAQDSTKTTPLMEAVKIEDDIIIRILLKAGADILLLDNENKSALHMECKEDRFSPSIGKLFFKELCKKFSSYEEIAEELIRDEIILYQACVFGNCKIIEYLLDRNYPANSTEPTTKQSALHIAIAENDTETAKLLISRGANINAPDIEGFTPLYYIDLDKLKNMEAQLELLKILLNREDLLATSCTPSGVFQIGSTLLFGNKDAIRIVLKSNIDITAKDKYTGRCVLHYLAMNKQPGVIDEIKLCINKYDVNVIDNNNMTPLHVAIVHNNCRMVQLLLQNQADTNAHMKSGYTPLFYAFLEYRERFKDEYDQCIELLLQHSKQPQWVCTHKKNKQITIIDTVKKRNKLHRLKPVIAHLAMLQVLGEPIMERISTQINSHSVLKKYFNKCQNIVRKNISGTVTFSKLLTSDKKKIARYSGNKNLVLKLKRLDYNTKLKSVYPYYYNVLKKCLPKGMEYKRFSDKAAEILCEILSVCFEKVHLFINKIMYFLDDETLQLLCRSSIVTQ